jgi:serine phosphatase RsbU (regulator of sigma subunit)
MNTSKKSDPEKAITYSRNAEDRMIERGITRHEVESALSNPIRTKSARKGRHENQAWIIRSGQRKLLRVVSEGDINILVITVMATSKFEKYGVSE